MSYEVDFDEIKKEYIAGTESLRFLAEKYGITYSAIANRSKKDGWVKLRDRVRVKRDAKTVDKISTEQSKTRIRLYKAADKALDRVSELLNNNRIVFTAKELRSLSGALKDLKEVRDIRTVLDLEEQTARIEKLRKDAREDERDDNTVIVRFADDESGDFGV